MSKVLFTPGGKIQFDATGKIMFGSAGDPCGCCVPADCPCDPWPVTPTSGDFPCGPLAYQYKITSYRALRQKCGQDTGQDCAFCCAGGDTCSGGTIAYVEWRLKSEITMTAAGSCLWSNGSAVVEKRSVPNPNSPLYDFSTISAWADEAASVNVGLDTGNNRWEIGVPWGAAYKYTGLTPAGDYYFFACDTTGWSDGTDPNDRQSDSYYLVATVAEV